MIDTFKNVMGLFIFVLLFSIGGLFIKLIIVGFMYVLFGIKNKLNSIYYKNYYKRTLENKIPSRKTSTNRGSSKNK